ncbi:mechanosensitive ion channel family protein, partial [Silvibacterium sp.]|uniref:mechanosensitive ion channel family protein n=1 Tax=Silvibacterium sp. TaxID=1964179 RepID=UPI0039E39376
LRKQAVAFQAPISKIVHNLVVEGQQLTQQTMQSSPAGASTQSTEQSADTQLQSITTGFRAISAASVPLAQEIVLLEQSEANLNAWKSAVDREYKSILHSLLLRLLVIAIALVVIFLAGELWTRAANKYVKDRRRRRQLLMTRRVVVSFLSALTLLFGFITQFNSLATFAGFITAGIAVGLQTILLSVAAYFFIIGKYGIKVGDRITIAGVTGDVIDVGLVRFYVMELAGSGTELKPSGRVAVFSNSVLFQATTPLYKQLPGSDFAWHELIVKFTAAADPRKASEQLLKAMHTVYDNYRHAIEKDHQNLEKWMQVSAAMPEIESRIQFLGGAVQLWTRFPVELRRAAEIDEELTEALLDLLEKDAELKGIVDGLPVIQASVKG